MSGGVEKWKHFVGAVKIKILSLFIQKQKKIEFSI